MPDNEPKPLAIIGFLLSFLVPVSLAVYGLISATRVPSKTYGLTILLFSYLALIISFASLYYTVIWVSDMQDAVDQYYYYRHVRKAWSIRLKLDPPRRTESSRAFKGIERHLWSGIEESARPFYYQADMQAPVPDILALTDFPDDGFPKHVVEYDQKALWPVFLDAIHYSIVTMATVGYGDIIPQTRLAKVVTDIQIISGQALFVFALGLVFGKVGKRLPNPQVH